MLSEHKEKKKNMQGYTFPNFLQLWSHEQLCNTTHPTIKNVITVVTAVIDITNQRKMADTSWNAA